MTNHAETDRLIRLPDVIDRVSIGKTMIYRKIRAGSFPAPYKLGPKSSRWSEREVMEWIRSVRAGAANQNDLSAS